MRAVVFALVLLSACHRPPPMTPEQKAAELQAERDREEYMVRQATMRAFPERAIENARKEALAKGEDPDQAEAKTREEIRQIRATQEAQDLYSRNDTDCKFQSTAATVNMQPYALIPLERIATQRQLWELCMQSKGY